ncbi:MIP/aquaporin family protein [Planctomycetes bacterium K23_9]|uniref:Glycerol uptake facilitator protein n=1 Tax=Stieleria marina TaxID=1930275 RepID=A0A517NZ10_9BACT|nr:Glycerol uptake facilitator protein [Planctomycetes bacterium K23_9]
MDAYVAEFFGTALLILIGGGVNANASLSKTFGSNDSNWNQIAIGWALAVYVGVICSQEASGAHLNPAVSIGLAAAGKFSWSLVVGYITAQFLGAFAGAVLVYLFYFQHYAVTTDADAKLATFCTSPAIRGYGHNVFGEAIGTFVLVFAVLMASGAKLITGDGGAGASSEIGLGALGALPVALVVFAVGIALGGTSGYAINPARDLAPRCAHAVLPIPGKRNCDWSYAWVPIVGPIIGGAVAALAYRIIEVI